MDKPIDKLESSDDLIQKLESKLRDAIENDPRPMPAIADEMGIFVGSLRRFKSGSEKNVLSLPKIFHLAEALGYDLSINLTKVREIPPYEFKSKKGGWSARKDQGLQDPVEKKPKTRKKTVKAV